MNKKILEEFDKRLEPIMHTACYSGGEELLEDEKKLKTFLKNALQQKDQQRMEEHEQYEKLFREAREMTEEEFEEFLDAISLT